MKRVCKLTLSTLGLLLLGVALAASDACAQTAKDFVGTWTLVSAVTEQGGTKTDTFGPNSKGILVGRRQGFESKTHGSLRTFTKLQLCKRLN